MRARLLWLFIWLPGMLLGQQWSVDSSHITFKIKNAGIEVDGSFSGLNMDMEFDPQDPQNGHIHATLEAATVATGIRIRDKHLRRSDYFDVANFPHITMRSQDFAKGNPHQFSSTFLVSIKGEEGQVTLPFSFDQQGNQAIMEGSFEIDRRRYHLGDDSMILANQVIVEIWVKVSEQ